MDETDETHKISGEIQNFILDRRTRHLALGTIDYYSQELGYWQTWLTEQGRCNVEDLDAGILRQWFLHLEERGRNPGGVHASWRAVKAFMLWFETEYEPDHWRNPIRKIEPPKINTDPRPGITKDDLLKLLDTCADRKNWFDLRDRAIFLTLFDTGLRRHELVMLNVGNVDLSTGQITTLYGKGRKARMVYIGLKTRRVLSRYLKKRGECKPSDPLFVIKAGTRMSEDGLRQMLVNRSHKAGLAKVPGLHDFRRAFALEFLRLGGDVFTLQRLMGHSSLNILRRYLDQNQDDLEKEHEAHGPVDGLDIS